MGFFKKLLGMDKLEEKYDNKIEKLNQSMKTSWSWINYLHELEQDNKKQISSIREENNELKTLIKEINEHKKIPVQVQEKVKAAATKAELEVPEPAGKKSMKFKQVDISGLGKKEGYILQILYKLASFDIMSSIPTMKVYEHLPFNISERGLRKKMYRLEKLGLIVSVKRGNSRKWHLDMDKLKRLKSFLTMRNQ